jgi:ATP-dependent Zn protease
MIAKVPWGLIILIATFLIMLNLINNTSVPEEKSYGEFYKILKEEPQKFKYLEKVENEIKGEMTDNTKFVVNIPENDPELIPTIRQNVPKFSVKPLKTFWIGFCSTCPRAIVVSVSGG